AHRPRPHCDAKMEKKPQFDSKTDKNPNLLLFDPNDTQELVLRKALPRIMLEILSLSLLPYMRCTKG
ncbi:hypothetical protein E2562_032210, partial [Oryza meyeriana var. granulata]